MEKKINQSLIYFKLTLSLFILITLTNCERNENSINSSNLLTQNTNYVQVEQVKSEDIKEVTKLYEIINTFNSITNIEITANKSSSDFIVNTEIANYALLGDNHTYSFQIYRPFPADKLENLLLVYNNGEYESFFLEYDLPNKTIEGNHNNNDINTNVKITPLDFNKTSNKTFGVNTICNYDVVLTHSGDLCDGCGFWVTTLENVSCSGGGGGGSSTGNFGSGNGSPTGGGSNSSSGSSNSIPLTPITQSSYQQEISNCLSSYIFDGNTTVLTLLNTAPYEEIKNIATFLNNYECSSEVQEFTLLAFDALINGEIESFEVAKDFFEADFAPNILDSEKIDPTEELKCFDLTKSAKLTVYVQQPLENSNIIVGPNQVGHAFIGIEQGGIKRQLGFYPEEGANRARVAVGKIYDSELRSNNNYLYHVSISQDILASQLKTITNYIKKFPKKYDVNHYACTDFAIKIGNLGGMNLPSTTMKNFTFEGRSPGQLGQEIRAMNSNNIKTIQKIKANSPNKEGECN